MEEQPNNPLAGLNEAQIAAVTTTEGSVRVIAGAGSGKTRALARRFAYLVNVAGVMPGNILCVTFTNKAANEMRSRIRALTGDNDTGYVNTFHGFCVSVLQEDANAVHYPKRFLVLDNSDINTMLDIIYEERGLTLRDMTYGAARDMIEIQKLFKKPLYYLDMIRSSPEELRRKYMEATAVDDIIFYGYLYQEKKCFGLDYNDLIVFSLAVFEANDDIRLKWQKRLQYIMIDEFQDIDSLQYRLMEVLAGYHKNLFIVGDPDQTIYTWRGANVKYLLEFDQHFPHTTTIMMNDNYRSTPPLLAVANSLISHNTQRMEKSLVPHRAGAEFARCYHAESSEAEATWIAESTEHMHRSGIPYKDICILYRAHYVTRSVEEAFIKAEIPYRIYSGAQFFDRMEVKDALAYLRMVLYRDDLSFTRVCNKPRRNIGEKRMKFLAQVSEGQGLSLFESLRRVLDDATMKNTKAREFVELIDRYSQEAANQPVSELLAHLLDESGYEHALRTEGSQERLDNLAELRQSIYEYETTCGEEATLDHYLTHVAMFSNLDEGMGGDEVKMMTIHAAKGLEFPHVFLCAANEGVTPSRKTKTKEAMEEERRLAFVALTRAQDSLSITCADRASHEGIPRYPSRFVLEIDPDLLDFETPLPDSLVAETRAYVAMKNKKLTDENAPSALSANTRIHHDIFGAGTILSYDEDAHAYEIQFDSLATPRTLSARVALKTV